MARDMTIRPVLNGFIVQVGCQAAVATSIEELTHNIGRYYRNPEEVEKEFLTRAVNKPPLQAEPCRNVCETSQPQATHDIGGLVEPRRPTDRR